MRWSDVLTLIHEAIPLESADATNENGFSITNIGEPVMVYANIKSVGFNEFYKAKMAGYTAEMKFDVFTAEYSGQTLAEYNGKRYRVLRSYRNPKTEGEYTELTLSDLSERGGGMVGYV